MMRGMSYTIAIGLAALALFTFPQSAHAQPALGGTDWEADPDCIFYGLHFSADGTGKLIMIVDEGELKVPTTWTLDGSRLSVKFPDRPDDSLVGTFDNASLQVTDNWKDKDNQAHVTNCTFTQMK